MKSCRCGWRRSGIRASVLIITLLVSAIIFMIAVSFSTMVTMESKTSQAADDANLALYEADAGLRRAFVELVNLDWDRLKGMIETGDPFSLTGGCFLSSSRRGSYSIKITFVRELSGAERYEVTKSNNDDYTGSRGKYQWRFKVLSVGQIGNAGTVFSQRTVVALVDIQRAKNADEYRGSGNIFYWSEMNR